MSTAVVVILVVMAVLAAITLGIRTSARKGMPSKEVLQRAKQRSRELEAAEKAERSDRGD
jgi:type II secretory pathway component PulK